ASEVGAVFVTSPTGVLDLVYYLSSDSDPSEDSLPPALELPLVSPFLCFDDSKADSESEPAEQRPQRHKSLFVHDVMVSRWRDRVTSRPSSPLSWRRVSHRSSDHDSLPDFTSDSSSSGSSLDSSSDTSSCPPLDSLTNTSLVYFQGAMHQVRLIQYHRLELHHLESSSDSFFERSLDSSSLSAGPSRKRCRSPTTSVPLFTYVSRLIAPTHADILPPHKRFKDSYLSHPVISRNTGMQHNNQSQHKIQNR
nr:hypothetical protein [Tanacetum cinerariifolium]